MPKSDITVFFFPVGLPGLHISVGVFHKFFKIEDECSVHDIKIVRKLAEEEEVAGNEMFKVSLNRSKRCHV